MSKAARQIVLLNKPYGVLTQFTDKEGRATLAEYITLPDIYAAGRLDRDSEGLLVLTNDGKLNQRITAAGGTMSKTYWVQVEGELDALQQRQLSEGVLLKDGMTLPARCAKMPQPDQLWPRDPPIRVRKHIADSWLSLTISEGRNRQVRRMCAAVGLPVLRLIRYRVGSWTLDGLGVGESRLIG